MRIGLYCRYVLSGADVSCVIIHSSRFQNKVSSKQKTAPSTAQLLLPNKNELQHAMLGANNAWDGKSDPAGAGDVPVERDNKEVLGGAKEVTALLMTGTTRGSWKRLGRRGSTCRPRKVT
jgi:hypothetical protein